MKALIKEWRRAADNREREAKRYNHMGAMFSAHQAILRAEAEILRRCADQVQEVQT